jgi:S-(hydroxymethyl)mycothiol dehydrogenase
MTMRTRGVVIRARHAPATVEELELDAPQHGEVLVRTLTGGVCHSDIHTKHGGLGGDFPYLLGHEGAGVVEMVGPGVDAPVVGDLVALAYRSPCGSCRFCRRGELTRCPDPVASPPRMRTADGLPLGRPLGLGTFAERLVVHAAQAVPIPADTPPEIACMLGCSVSTGVGAVLNTAGVTPGSRVAVIGCGGVGCNVILGARLARASEIVAIDRDPRKLDWARTFGATTVVDAAAGDAVAAVRAATGGLGVNYAFDAVGRSDTLRQALDMLDYKGTATLIGFPSGPDVLDLPLIPYFLSGATLRVSLGGDSLPSRDFPLYAQWRAAGQLDLDRLVTRTIGIDDVEPAFEALLAGETIKSVIRFDRS